MTNPKNSEQRRFDRKAQDKVQSEQETKLTCNKGKGQRSKRKVWVVVVGREWLMVVFLGGEDVIGFEARKQRGKTRRMC